MKVKAYGLNFQEEDIVIIRKMGKIITQQPIDIFDLGTYQIESSEEDVLLLFGYKANKDSEGKKFLGKLEFPEIDKLAQKHGDPEERKAANKKLRAFREKLDSKSFQDTEQKTNIRTDVLTEAQLPKASQIQSLEDQIKQKQIDSWIGETREGKRIKLTQESETDTADVNLTFAEFMALNRFMEVFGVKETKIVYKPSASNH
jgi:hypothetical protein